jgi:hypothetical protein
MFFILDDLPNLIRIVLVIVIFGVNGWFFTLWLHLFFRDSRFSALRFLALFLGKISFLGKDYWKKEVIQSLKTEGGMNFLFGKGFKDDMKMTKLEEAKDADDNIIGSSDQSKKGDPKGDKYEEVEDDLKEGETKDPATGDVKGKKKKKKKKAKKKPNDGLIDNQYEGDELPAEEAGGDEVDGDNLDMTKDLDKTNAIDQTRDEMNADPLNLNELEASLNSGELPKPKKKKGKKKKKKKKAAKGNDD